MAELDLAIHAAGPRNLPQESACGAFAVTPSMSKAWRMESEWSANMIIFLVETKLLFGSGQN
jgi:hypothetical protein